MNEHHMDDTPINLYLKALRDQMYKYVGLAEASWIQRFELKFYEIANSDDKARYRLGMIMALSTLRSLTGTKVHYQDILEQLE